MNYISYTHGTQERSDEEVTSLVADLHNVDGLVRRRARRALVDMGQPAVPILMQELAAPKEYTRWEAAKALCEIQAPEAAPALVQRLDDENFSVRWLAAEALASLDRAALVPLLKALVYRADSIWLRRGAHHVFRELARKGMGNVLDPVLEALDGLEPILEVPIAAERALQDITGVH